MSNISHISPFTRMRKQVMDAIHAITDPPACTTCDRCIILHEKMAQLDRERARHYLFSPDCNPKPAPEHPIGPF